MAQRKMFYGAKGDLFKKARMLRKNETEAEIILWKRLRGNQLKGLRFKRQHPIAYYVADFYCHKAKLVIELDGDYHSCNDQKLYDKVRTQFLNELGLTVLRFSDDQVIQNIDEVLETIAKILFR